MKRCNDYSKWSLLGLGKSRLNLGKLVGLHGQAMTPYSEGIASPDLIQIAINTIAPNMAVRVLKEQSNLGAR